MPQPAARTAPAPKAAAGKPAAKAPTVDVQRFVRDNITPFDGDATFLAGPTPRTLELWDEVQVSDQWDGHEQAGRWVHARGGAPAPSGAFRFGTCWRAGLAIWRAC